MRNVFPIQRWLFGFFFSCKALALNNESVKISIVNVVEDVGSIEAVQVGLPQRVDTFISVRFYIEQTRCLYNNLYMLTTQDVA